MVSDAHDGWHGVSNLGRLLLRRSTNRVVRARKAKPREHGEEVSSRMVHSRLSKKTGVAGHDDIRMTFRLGLNR